MCAGQARVLFVGKRIGSIRSLIAFISVRVWAWLRSAKKVLSLSRVVESSFGWAEVDSRMQRLPAWSLLAACVKVVKKSRLTVAVDEMS